MFNIGLYFAKNINQCLFFKINIFCDNNNKNLKNKVIQTLNVFINDKNLKNKNLNIIKFTDHTLCSDLYKTYLAKLIYSFFSEIYRIHT